MQSDLSEIRLFSFLEKNRMLLVYLPLGIYWTILFVSTSLPLKSVPSIGLSDKIMHTIAYAGLAVLLFLTLTFQRKFFQFCKFPILYTVAIGMVYAVFDELHQLLIPGRKCDILDIIADGVGIVAGLVLIRILYHFRSMKPQKTDH